MLFGEYLGSWTISKRYSSEDEHNIDGSIEIIMV